MAFSDYSNLKNQYQYLIQYCQNLKVGDKIKFESEKHKYTVKAKNDRYLICTKPFNLQKTVLYTIVDLERLVRGTNNMVFNPYDYADQKDIDKCLEDLQNHSNGLEVTYRNCVWLDVEII
jgi:S-adenosylmethionine:tRNA-ribosyltransferase-isomerase (queuine synthetase)